MRSIRPRPHRVIVLLALAVALLVPTQLAPAQNVPDKINPNPLITLDFAGGTMSEFAAALKAAAAPNPINIVLRGNAPEIDVPPMDLAMVSLDSAMRLAVPNTGTSTVVEPNGEAIRTAIGLDRISDFDSTPVYLVELTVTRQGSGINPFRSGYQPQIEVFSLEQVIQDSALGVESIIAAVEAALDLDASAAPPAEVRYHDETALLIIRGAREQIHVVESVIRNLSITARTREDLRSRLTSDALDWELDVARRAADLQEVSARVAIAVSRRDGVSKLADSGLASEAEVHEAASEIMIAEARLTVAHAELKAAQSHHARAAVLLAATAPERWVEVYTISGSADARARTLEAVSIAASISARVSAIEAPSDAGTTAIQVEADETGHAAIKALIELLGAR